ncbi:MAG: hypothetical protein WCQ95_07280 [Bacteroidota bacterium]
MKKIILGSIILISLIMFYACNKTEQTYKKIYRRYTLNNYTVNGVDSLSLYKDSLNTDFYFFRDNMDNVDVCTISGGHIGWVWYLSNDNKSLNVITSNSLYEVGGTGPFGQNKTPTWEIINLTKKELIMRTSYNSKIYVIELK